MPRIPYLRDEELGTGELVEAIRKRRGGGLLNLDRLLLHSPPVAAGWNQLLGAVRTQLSLSPRLGELAICAVAVLNDAPYEFHHHAPVWLQAGATQAQVDALADIHAAAERRDLFDATERAVLRVTIEMTEGAQVSDEAFAQLRALLGEDRQVFELVTTVAAYNMVSRVITALHIEPEQAPGAASAAAASAAAATDGPAPVQAGRINVHGAAIAYRLEGPADAPVLMLANSLAADMGMWDDNLPAFSAHYRVLRYDMRGHGASSTPPGPYDMDMLADDAIAVLDALKLQRVHFVGVSLGGMVGQRLAARYPNRIARLVLCATMSHQPAPAAWDERIALIRRAGLAAIADATLQRWFTEAFRKAHPATVARVRAMVLATRADGYLGCAAPIRDLAQDALLPRIAAPCLVMAGRADPAATPGIAQAMAASIPGARLHVVEDAAHLPNIERPEAFDAAVLGFLGGASGADPRL